MSSQRTGLPACAPRPLALLLGLLLPAVAAAQTVGGALYAGDVTTRTPAVMVEGRVFDVRTHAIAGATLELMPTSPLSLHLGVGVALSRLTCAPVGGGSCPGTDGVLLFTDAAVALRPWPAARTSPFLRLGACLRRQRLPAEITTFTVAGSEVVPVTYRTGFRDGRDIGGLVGLGVDLDWLRLELSDRVTSFGPDEATGVSHDITWSVGIRWAPGPAGP